MRLLTCTHSPTLGSKTANMNVKKLVEASTGIGIWYCQYFQKVLLTALLLCICFVDDHIKRWPNPQPSIFVPHGN